MRIILLGAPGAGKNTQGALLAAHFRIPRIATAEFLRMHPWSAAMVPAALAAALIKERIGRDDCRRGYLIEGFPSTVGQARALRAAGVAIDYVLAIEVADEAIAERLDAATAPAAERARTIRQALADYHARAEPLVSYYNDWAAEDAPDAPGLRRVAGTGTIAQVGKRIISALQPRPEAFAAVSERNRRLTSGWRSDIDRIRAAKLTAERAQIGLLCEVVNSWIGNGACTVR